MDATQQSAVDKAWQNRTEEVRQFCQAALRQSDLAEVDRILTRTDPGFDALRIVAAVTQAPEGQHEVMALDARLRSAGYNSETALQQYLLVRSCLRVLDDVPRLPVTPKVIGLMFDAFARMAALNQALAAAFKLGEYPFTALSKIASLRRFTAGQFDWEISGVSRSFFLKASKRDLPAMLRTVAGLGGLRPLFMPHFSIFRSNWLVLLEREVNRAQYQIARSMELQPHIRGYVASSWFYAPETYRLSPHLSWLRSTIVENGGFATVIGPARASGGVLAQSIQRKQAYESGTFKPLEGLIIWPRAAMLNWAAAHPEYAD